MQEISQRYQKSDANRKFKYVGHSVRPHPDSVWRRFWIWTDAVVPVLYMENHCFNATYNLKTHINITLTWVGSHHVSTLKPPKVTSNFQNMREHLFPSLSTCMFISIIVKRRLKKTKTTALTSRLGWGLSQHGPGLLALLYTSRGDEGVRSDMCRRGRKYHTSAATSAADGLFAACERAGVCRALKKGLFMWIIKSDANEARSVGPRQLGHRARRSHAARVKTSVSMIDYRRCCVSHESGFICRVSVCSDFYLYSGRFTQELPHGFLMHPPSYLELPLNFHWP